MNSIAKIYDFLGRLAENNNRDWFAAHRDEYDEVNALWLADVQRLIDHMSLWDKSLTGLKARDSVYRIYRDTRFSPDKSPYKRHFGALIGQGGRKCALSCCYVHIQPGNSGLHGGIWCPERDVLDALRHAIDDNIEEFLEILNRKEFARRFSLFGDTLKKMPRGFAADNPNGKYIKMKEYLLEGQRSDDWFINCDDWTEKAAADFRLMQDFHNFMNFTIKNEV